ncbi:MAG: TonB-dependent receptor [Betaproteobacteria bacterium]
MKFPRTPIACATQALCSIGLAALALQTNAVQAQGATSTPGSPSAVQPATADPQQITVTATRRDEAAHRVPINISALSEDELRDQNITDAKKLIAASDAINAPGNSARFADSVTVRGLNVSPVAANNLEQFIRSTLAYYLDDTMLPHLGYRIKDIARVETLLGPQGTLYGAGSLGGTIRFISNQPKLGKTEGRISTSFYQTRHGGLSNDTDGVVNLPLGPDLALRASVARLDEKGYTDRLSNPPWRTGTWAWSSKPDANRNLYENDDWQKVNTGRIALRWRLTPSAELTFTHAQQSQLAHGSNGASVTPLNIANATNAAQVDAAWRLGRNCTAQGIACTYKVATEAPFVVNDHTIVSRYPEFADRSFRLDSVDLDVNLGFAKLHSNTSRFRDARVGQADYARQGNLFYNWFTAGNIQKSNNSLYMTFDNTYTGTTHETRLVSSGKGPLSWVAGVFLMQQKRNYKFDEMFPGLDTLPSQGDFISIAAQGGRKSLGGVTDSGYAEDLGSQYREKAVFGEVSYALSPALKMTYGTRVFSYEDVGTAFVFDYAGGLADNNSRASSSGSSKAIHKVNLVYSLNQDLLSYLTFSQGFRRGGNNGFKSFPSKNQIVAPGTNGYGPDTTNNLELGLKGFLLDRRLLLQTAVYRIDWKNVQTYYSQGLPDPFGLGIDFPINGTTNGPNARSVGGELSARLALNQHWQTHFSAATTASEWTSTLKRCTYIANNRPEDCRTWSAGGKLYGAPSLKYTAGVQYNRMLGSGHEFTSSLSRRWVGKIGNDRTDAPDTNPPLFYPAYALVNASAGLAKGPWNATMWVQNLADTRALVSIQSPFDQVVGPRLIYSTPRTVGLNLSYRF